ncbi:MAG: type II secretion system minor pseudopilin GspJ [Dokdonella sp.]
MKQRACRAGLIGNNHVAVIARTFVAGFTLVELLVALAVFAAVAAIAFGGLAQIAQTRGALAASQDRFTAIARGLSSLGRDIQQAIARPVRGNYGEVLPALIGASDHIELTRLGFANPLAEARSNLERVAYGLDQNVLQRARFAVLDRAPGSVPATTPLFDQVTILQLRYLGASDGIWRDIWPPPLTGDPTVLPRAIELRVTLSDIGELRRVFDLPSALPARAGGTVPAGTPPLATPPAGTPLKPVLPGPGETGSGTR